MKQHISTFTKFVNEGFKEPLAPTHEELETLESFRRLREISKIAGLSGLPEWSTQPRMYANGNRQLTLPVEWPMTPRKWAFYPTGGTLITDDGYTRRRDIDYSTERGWNVTIDWIIIQCIIAIVDSIHGNPQMPAEMGIYQGETNESFDEGLFNRSLRGGRLDEMITALGVGIGDLYDFATLRSLIELIYEPITGREMILALSGVPVKLTRINR